MKEIVKLNNYRGWSVEEERMYKPVFPTWCGAVEVWNDNIPQNGTNSWHHQNGPENIMILEQEYVLPNGLRVFEGDILMERMKNLLTGSYDEVKYKITAGTGALIAVNIENKRTNWIMLWSDRFHNSNFEYSIVGNIHE